jgi:uncharacterized protein (TIGR03435 family)
MRRIGRFAALVGSLAMLPAAFWLARAQAPQAEVKLVHPEDGATLAFEVATIKPNPDAGPGLRIQLSPAHFSVTHGSPRDLIKFAYGIKTDDQVVGGPGWMATESFDIQGKASEADVAAFDKLGLDEKMTMSRLFLQTLLQDRFHLKTHIETRDLPVYALEVANGGSKMKEVVADPLPAAGAHPAPGAHLPAIRMTGTNQVTATAWPMKEFAEWLSFSYEIADRPVIDETGLKGNYDFVLSGVSQKPPPPSDGTSQEPVVSIFAALPEQLGLKLIPRKAPVEVLVIESIEQPSAN